MTRRVRTPRDTMTRKEALKMAQTAQSDGRGPLSDYLRNQILDTQIIDPLVPRVHISFPGWTTAEKLAFYTDGTVPKRFKA